MVREGELSKARFDERLDDRDQRSRGRAPTGCRAMVEAAPLGQLFRGCACDRARQSRFPRESTPGNGSALPRSAYRGVFPRASSRLCPQDPNIC
jgi:hypothetical protein